MPTYSANDIGLLVSGARSVLKQFKVRLPNGNWRLFVHEDLKDDYTGQNPILFTTEEVSWKPKKGEVNTIELLGGDEMFYETKRGSCEISANFVHTDQIFGLYHYLPGRVKDVIIDVYDGEDSKLASIIQVGGTPGIVSIPGDLTLSDNKLNKELVFYIEKYAIQDGNLPTVGSGIIV